MQSAGPYASTVVRDVPGGRVSRTLPQFLCNNSNISLRMCTRIQSQCEAQVVDGDGFRGCRQNCAQPRCSARRQLPTVACEVGGASRDGKERRGGRGGDDGVGQGEEKEEEQEEESLLYSLIMPWLSRLLCPPLAVSRELF